MCSCLLGEGPQVTQTTWALPIWEVFLQIQLSLSVK